jgi:hypothetical protein
MRPQPLPSALVCFACLVSGCAPTPARFGGASFTERSVVRALDAVKANDEQRARVLGAFEVARPKLDELRYESASLHAQMRDLSPVAEDYLAKTDAMAVRLGEIATEQARVQAHLVHDAAAALTTRQWDRFVDFFREPLEDPGLYATPRENPERRQ